MPQEPFTAEEISLRNREDRFIQESKKDYERTDRVRAVEDARKERARKVQADTQEIVAKELYLRGFTKNPEDEKSDPVEKSPQ